MKREDLRIATVSSEEIKSRKAIYELLSSMYYREVPLTFLEGMKQESISLNSEFDTYISSVDSLNMEKERIELAAEFARLFLGMSKNSLSPYESVYTSSEKILMREARDDALAAYRQERLMVASDLHLPEDHISFELEFMASLGEKTLQAMLRNDEEQVFELIKKQKVFFEGHIENWVPRFCSDVKKRSRSLFYKGIADLTETFIDSEKDFFYRDTQVFMA